jgi:hypothetical protein
MKLSFSAGLACLAFSKTSSVVGVYCEFVVDTPLIVKSAWLLIRQLLLSNYVVSL